MEFLEDKHFFISHILPVLVILAGAVLLSRIVQFLVNRFIDNSSAHIGIDRTKYKFFKNAVDFTIFGLAFISALYITPAFKGLASTLFAGAGLFAAILGFASQQAFSNIISGVFIVISKPFRIDDNILISQGANELSGIVEDITLRHTVIRNGENRRIIIPNALIGSQTITNSNIIDEKVCRHIELVVDYDVDIELAMKILQDAAINHPKTVDNRSEEEKADNQPIVSVRITELEESGARLRAAVWAENPADAFDIKCDVNQEVMRKFKENHISVAHQQRTIVLKKSKKNKKTAL